MPNKHDILKNIQIALQNQNHSLADSLIKDYESGLSQEDISTDITLWQLKTIYAFSIKDYDLALLCAKKACELNPENLDSWENLGKCYYIKKDPDKAIDTLLHVLKGGKHDILGFLLKCATESYNIDKIIQYLPFYSENDHLFSKTEETCGLMAYALSYYDFEIAKNYYEKIIPLFPDSIYLLNNYALFLRDNHQCDEAEKIYAKCDEILPNNPVICVNRGYNYLTYGEYEKGLPLHERRFETEKVTRITDYDIVPKKAREWGGRQDYLRDHQLLIYAEQGYGEGLMFSRFLHFFLYLEEEKRPESIVLLCQLGLERLFCHNFSKWGIQILPAHSQMEDTGIIYNYTRHVPLMSLPYKFGVKGPMSPEKPYLEINPVWKEDFAEIFEKSCPKKYKVGIIWQGSPRLHDSQAAFMNIRRSLDFKHLEPLITHPKIEAYSLQVGKKDESFYPYEKEGLIQNLGIYCGDFADCATLMDYMDFIVTVDTGTCHLAGALGKKTFLLNRYDSCWRWGLEGEKTAWYPSMTIIRQNKEYNWPYVIDKLIKKIDEL